MDVIPNTKFGITGAKMAVGVGSKMATGGYATAKALYPWIGMTPSYIFMHWSSGRTNFFRAWGMS